jgi:hypothetical protein
MMIRLLVATTFVAALPLTCGNNDGPGQVNYRGTLTVINRTQADVTLMSGPLTLTVPSCAEGDANGALINWWNVTSPGRDMIRSGGGVYEHHSYLIVTNVVRQVPSRPVDLPACIGLLQGGG